MASGGITVETDPVFSASPAASITDAKKAEWDSKQDKISDLDAIRSGASAGATAVQPNEDVYVWNWNGEQEGALTTEEFDAMYNAKLVILGLFNAPLMKAMGDENNLSLVMSMTSADSVEYLAFMLSREDQTFAMLEQSSFPIGVTEEMISDFGFTKNTGDYSKPQNGIPKSDLASSVQASLGKADSALQSYTEQYKGTVTGVKINGSTKSPSSGTVDLGNVATSIKINGSTKNPSNGIVDLGTVITAHQTLKTINGQSIVGSGDITISGGGEEYAEPYLVDYGGGGMGACFAIEDDINSPMLPDVTYICPVPVMVVWVQTLQPPTGNVGKYTFHFNVGNDGAMVYIDESILMAGTRPETLEPNVSCELSIIATKIGNTYTYKAVLTSFS